MGSLGKNCLFLAKTYIILNMAELLTVHSFIFLFDELKALSTLGSIYNQLSS